MIALLLLILWVLAVLFGIGILIALAFLLWWVIWPAKGETSAVRGRL